MDGGNESPIMWIAGLGLIGITLIYIWIIGDPMLIYLFLITSIMALFPTYKAIIAFISLLGVYKIALRHDVIVGDFSSFIMSVGEGLDITVGGTAVIVTLMALIPAAKALFSFDIYTVIQSIKPAASLLLLVLTRVLIENKSDTDIGELIGLAIQHLKEFFKNIRLFTGT